MTDRPVILFDTDCVLCSGMVAFVLEHERAPEFAFVGAWSQTGAALAASHGFAQADLDETFLVIVDGEVHHHSDGGIEILERLRPPWPWGRVLRFVPRRLRDGVYSFVARRRYRWFGRKTNCFVPTPNQRARFLDLEGSSPRGA